MIVPSNTAGRLETLSVVTKTRANGGGTYEEPVQPANGSREWPYTARDRYGQELSDLDVIKAIDQEFLISGTYQLRLRCFPLFPLAS